MKKELSKKLAAYSATVAAAIISAQSAKAQVVYNDIADITIDQANPYHQIDLNNDGVTDFALAFKSFEGVYAVGIYGASGNGVVLNYGSYVVRNFPCGAQVCPTVATSVSGWAGLNEGNMIKIFASSANSYTGWSGYGGGGNPGTGFIGLRFKVNGEFQYGWARLTVVPNIASMVLLDYAYEATPNTCIGACDEGSLGVNHSNLSATPIDIELSPNPVSDQTTVEFSFPKNTDAEISLFDLQGRKIKTLAAENFSAGNHQLSFQKENLAAGVYLMQLKTDEGIASQKVVIE